MKTIEEITKASQKGCITDIAAIGRIVTRLAELPSEELKCPNAEPLMGVVSDYLMDCEMDKSRYLQVSYGDILGIIELIPSTKVYCEAFGEEFCQNMRLTLLAHIRNLLMEFDTKNDTVHLFMSISVKGYLDFLASKAGTTNIYEDFRQHVSVNTDFSISEDTTVKDFIVTMCSIQSQNWKPSTPTIEFTRNIRRSYEVLYSFFIKYFKEAFPECFDLKRLKEKYSGKEV